MSETWLIAILEWALSHTPSLSLKISRTFKRPRLLLFSILLYSKRCQILNGRGLGFLKFSDPDELSGITLRRSHDVFNDLDLLDFLRVELGIVLNSKLSHSEMTLTPAL